MYVDIENEMRLWLTRSVVVNARSLWKRRWKKKSRRRDLVAGRMPGEA